MAVAYYLVFVCTGNISRSPMAKLVFAEHVRRAGLADRIRVGSAATGPWHVGEPADPRAAELLAGRGYPTGHVAEQLGPAHLSADLFLAMTGEHRTVLRELGADPDRVRMLRSFDPAAGGNLRVPDPYGGDVTGYEQVLDMVEAAVPHLLAWVRERLPA